MISKSDLEYWYIHKEESIGQLMKRFHYGQPRLIKLFKEYDIPIRSQSEANRIMVKHNPHVQKILMEGRKKGNRFQIGNISQIKTWANQYGQIKDLMEVPFCHICGETKKKLIVHHLDFNRLNNLKENLIILCHSCHRKEHRYYEQFADGKTHYETLALNKKYNGLIEV